MKVGIFGGSFNPIHHGHLFSAETARLEGNLEKILFVPTQLGTHYKPLNVQISRKHRLHMIKLAIKDNPYFSLDLSDLSEDATGYTIDLLPRLQKKYPQDSLSFIVGSDSLVRSHWERLEDIFAYLENLFILPRVTISQNDLDNVLHNLVPENYKKVFILDKIPIDESATSLRERIKEDKTIRYLLPQDVLDYIYKYNLYV